MGRESSGQSLRRKTDAILNSSARWSVVSADGTVSALGMPQPINNNMRRLLPMLLALLGVSVFAEDSDVPLKPFRAQASAPARQTYRVAEGDTVYSVARKLGRDPKLILWLNRIDESAILPVGKVIFIGDAPVVSR
jgi:LysM repeat protein